MKQLKTKKKKKKIRFLSILLGSLCSSFLGNLLKGKGTNTAGEGTIKAGKNFNVASSFKDEHIIKMNLNLLVFFHKIIYLQ